MFRGGFKLFTILGDRCRECPGLARRCSDSGFYGVNLGITVGKTSRIAPGLQRFLISWGQLGNRCKVFPVYTLLRASILDFRPRLGNRCKVFPVYTLLRASILDFKPKLANRCSVSSLQRRMARLQRP